MTLRNLRRETNDSETNVICSVVERIGEVIGSATVGRKIKPTTTSECLFLDRESLNILLR